MLHWAVLQGIMGWNTVMVLFLLQCSTMLFKEKQVQFCISLFVFTWYSKDHFLSNFISLVKNQLPSKLRNQKDRTRPCSRWVKYSIKKMKMEWTLCGWNLKGITSLHERQGSYVWDGVGDVDTKSPHSKYYWTYHVLCVTLPQTKPAFRHKWIRRR